MIELLIIGVFSFFLGTHIEGKVAESHVEYACAAEPSKTCDLLETP
jgi:hypothetical protein